MNFEDYDIRILKTEASQSSHGDWLSYKDMIDYYTDDQQNTMILNNEVIKYEFDYWELENGNDYDEENDYYIDIYQYYILNDGDAERLKEHTNEIIYYNSKLDMYLLGVTHWGTSWTCVDTDFKKVHEDENYYYYKLEG